MEPEQTLPSESEIRLPPDGTGKSVRSIIQDDGRHQQVFTLGAADGTIIDPVRRGEGLAAGAEYIGNVGTVIGSHAGAGRFFTAGTGRISLGAAGNVRVIFANPAWSAKNLYLSRLACFNTMVAWVSLYVNPTDGIPGGVNRYVTNAILGGGVTPVARLRVDTDPTIPLSGGIDTGIVVGLGAGERTQIDLAPLILAPGVTLGMNIPYTDAADVALTLYWWEQ